MRCSGSLHRLRAHRAHAGGVGLASNAQGLTVPVVHCAGSGTRRRARARVWDKMPDTLSARLTRPDVPDASPATAVATLARTLAACSGSFLLAEEWRCLEWHRADGRHWWLADVSARYPNVNADESRMM